MPVIAGRAVGERGDRGQGLAPCRTGRPCRRRCRAAARAADRRSSRRPARPSAPIWPEHVDEGQVALQRAPARARARDPAARDGGGGEEVRRRRRVGLDRVVGAGGSRRAPTATDRGRPTATSSTPNARHHRRGHGRGRAATPAGDVSSICEAARRWPGADEQQAGTNWLETSPGRATAPPPEAAGRRPRPGGGPDALRLDARAERDQRVEQRRHRAGRAAARRRRAGSGRDRARPAAATKRDVVPDRRASSSIGPGRRAPAVPTTSDRRRRPVDLDVGTQAGEAVDHGLGVVGDRRRRRACWCPPASAAHTSARLVMLFEPGTATTGVERLGRAARRRCSGGRHGRPVSPAAARTGRNPRAISPPRNSSPCAASTSRISTPRSPSAEWDDLEVGDVDAELGGQREHLGGGAGAVGDGDAHLGQVLGAAGDPAGQVDPGVAGRGSSTAEQRVPVVAGHDVAAPAAEPVDEAVERVDDGVAVLGADVGPDGRVARRRCGSCPGSRRRPGAAGRRAPRPARRPGVISVAAVRWGTWRHDGHQRVVAVGREGDDLGAEVGHDPSARRRRRRRRCSAVGVSTQTAPSNRSASAPSTPSSSEPAIGWPPTKRGSAIAADASDAFTLPTSVTSAGGRGQRRGGPRRRSAQTGVATNVISASGS